VPDAPNAFPQNLTRPRVPLAAWVIRQFWRAAVPAGVCPPSRVARAFGALLGVWVGLFVLLLGVQLMIVTATNLRWLPDRGLRTTDPRVFLATSGLYLLAGFRAVRLSVAAARPPGAPGVRLWAIAGALAWAVILLGIGAAIVLTAG